MMAIDHRTIAACSLLLLAASACGATATTTLAATEPPVVAEASPGDGGALPIELEDARKAVADFVLAVTHQRKEELRRTFSFRALARDFRPKRVLELSPTLYARFVEDAAARMLDPNGAVYQLLAGLEVGSAKAHGALAVVEGKGRQGVVRFHIARRATGALHVSRIE